MEILFPCSFCNHTKRSRRTSFQTDVQERPSFKPNGSGQFLGVLEGNTGGVVMLHLQQDDKGERSGGLESMDSPDTNGWTSFHILGPASKSLLCPWRA